MTLVPKVIEESSHHQIIELPVFVPIAAVHRAAEKLVKAAATQGRTITTNVTGHRIYIEGDIKHQMGFPDTGPQPDGHRTETQWFNAIAEDMTLVQTHLTTAKETKHRDHRTQALAVAIKEAHRLTSDLYRYGEEIHQITRQEIDSIHT